MQTNATANNSLTEATTATAAELTPADDPPVEGVKVDHPVPVALDVPTAGQVERAPIPILLFFRSNTK